LRLGRRRRGSGWRTVSGRSRRFKSAVQALGLSGFQSAPGFDSAENDQGGKERCSGVGPPRDGDFDEELVVDRLGKGFTESVFPDEGAAIVGGSGRVVGLGLVGEMDGIIQVSLAALASGDGQGSEAERLLEIDPAVEAHGESFKFDIELTTEAKSGFGQGLDDFVLLHADERDHRVGGCFQNDGGISCVRGDCEFFEMKIGFGIDELLNLLPKSRLASDESERACGDDILHFGAAGSIGLNPDFLTDVEAGVEERASEGAEQEKEGSHESGGG